jgi:hypothetical protein
MQDAYMQEKGVAGNWMLIGYSAPGTGSSFSYASNVFEYSTTDTDLSGATNDWMADPKTDLNDCGTQAAKHGSWKLTAGGSGSLTITDASVEANCKSLTASWSNLTR